MTKFYQALGYMLLFLFSTVIHAAEPPKAPTADLKESLDEDDSYWELDAGAMVNFSRSYIKGINNSESGDAGINIMVSGGYYYKNFFVETHPLIGRPFTIGYSLQRTKRFVVNVIAESLFIGFDEDSQNHGDYLTGINERKTSLDLGLEASYSYKYGEARVRMMHDVSNTHKGYMVAFDYAYPIFHKRWVFWPSYGISWISDNATDYYFGIDENEARFDRPVYTPTSAITQRVSMYAAYQYNTHLSFIAHGAYAIFSNNINDSPLVSPNDDTYTIGMGVMWSF